jgi:hypothetical protein
MPLSTTCRYRRAERRTGCQCRPGHRKRMVFATSSEFSAERPTGEGLMLGMGLRDIGGEAGRMIQRRRSLWSGAEPDGLGGAKPHLIGLAGFSAECRRVSVKTRARFFPLAPLSRLVQWMPLFVRQSTNRHFSSLTTNQAAHIEKPENQSLWGYRFRVVPWRDKVCPFPRGFLYSHDNITSHHPRTPPSPIPLGSDGEDHPVIRSRNLCPHP